MLFVASAYAHSPHDVVPYVSLAEDGGIATLEDAAIAMSPDGWSVRWIGFPFATPACVFALRGDAVAAVVQGEGVWITEDDGLSWELVGGPTDAVRCVRTDGFLAVAGREGFWYSHDGRDWTGVRPTLSLLDVALNDEIWAIGADGALLVRRDGDWVRVAEGPYRALSSNGGALVLAPEEGPLELVVDDVPTPLPGAPEGVRALRVGAAWLAATATEGVWVSEDRGDTWRLEAEGLEELATGSGAPLDGVHFNELVAKMDHWWLAAWEGLFYWDGRWNQVPLRTLPLVNTLAWLDGELLVGTNGGGLYRGTPFGEDWRDVSRGIGWPWMRQLAVSGEEAWFVGAGDVLYRSVEQGRSWEVPPVRLPTGGDVTALSPAFSSDGRAIFGGLDEQGRALIAFTEDGGETWEHGGLLGDCTEKPGFGAMSAAMAWVSCGTELFESEDLRSWRSLGQLPAPVAMAFDGDASTWIATRAGLYRLTVGEAPALVDFDGQFLTAMTLLPSGEPLVAVRGSGLHTLTGHLPGWSVAEPVAALAVSPEGHIAVGSHLGLSVSTDGGQSFALACPYDRYDDHDLTWRWEGWAEGEDDRAKAGDVHLGVAGSEAWWTVEASYLRLFGMGEGARVEVEIDGESFTFSVNRAQPGLILSREVEPGVHSLHLRVLEGSVALDGGERWRWGRPAPREAVEEPEGCGCRGGRAGVLWLLLLPALRRARVRG